jgi:hypothetical protein
MADEERFKKERVPYYKYAFHNVYNYTVLGGIASAALLTQNWWLGIAGAGLETLWMVFGPDSKLLRRFWFDKVHADNLRAQEDAELAQKLSVLPPDERARVRKLMEAHRLILKLGQENQALTLDLLKEEIGKLDTLVKNFIELITESKKNEAYLATVDMDELEVQLRRHRAIAEQAQDEERRKLAEQNLAVLEKRQERLAELRRFVAKARAQLDLIENTFRLLGDQIVSMRSPKELGGQLDELIDGVESVRETARETQALVEAMER